MWHSKSGGNNSNDNEDGEYPPPRPEDRPSQAEIKIAAELLVFIEHDIGTDVSRIRIRVRGTHVFIYGTVDSEETKKEIENFIPTRKGVAHLHCQLAVQS
jgi:hypothetical protein